MSGPNLSEWALKHRSFVIFTMIVVTIAGLASYFRLACSMPQLCRALIKNPKVVATKKTAQNFPRGH
jgi:hypothetical protein